MNRSMAFTAFFIIFALAFAWHAAGGIGKEREGAGGAVRTCPAGDVNGDGQLDISDPVSLLEFLFLTGAPPVPCVAEGAVPAAAVSFDPAGSLLSSRTAQEALIELAALNAALASRVAALEGSADIELVPIPAGSFTMGSPTSERSRDSIESLHGVIITRPFQMGATEVTQTQFEALMGWNPSAFANCPECPVESINWHDAVEFCRRLTERHRRAGKIGAGDFYRLPTESEWEYACRAGTSTRFSWGNSLECSDTDPAAFCPSANQYLWYSGNASTAASGTKPVRRKQPNPWGLYDMHGNVWEWCSDSYGEYPQGEVTDPQGPAQGFERVLRGGSWSESLSVCRSARRLQRNPLQRETSYAGIGFRVLLEEGGE